MFNKERPLSPLRRKGPWRYQPGLCKLREPFFDTRTVGSRLRRRPLRPLLRRPAPGRGPPARAAAGWPAAAAAMADGVPFDEWKVIVAERINRKAARERAKLAEAAAKKAAHQEVSEQRGAGGGAGGGDRGQERRRAARAATAQQQQQQQQQ